uniref:complement C1q-like protein 2 isoform X3 n=1 Tax=Solea senegalensis TaxID=28829 RepID=UPI001CD8658E|nr:complement C1q-like protein 2 isoform X3 [Solea senegalensis]
MKVTLFFPLLLFCSLSTAEPPSESDNDIIPRGEQADYQGRKSANVSYQRPTCPQDIHAVLREMSSMLAEQKVELRHLQRENEAQAAKLGELKQQVQEQAGELTAVKAKTNVTENQVEALMRDREVKQVAFSASLLASGSGIMGPFNAHTNLVFRHVTTNIGNAYSPNTGFFIAPVRGAYHFEFYIGAHGSSHPSAAWLVKNGQHIFIAYEHQPSHYGSSSNGATLLLEVGDVVFLRLLVNTRIFDSEDHHSTFSGHLLFTM